jgi:Kef-type K+ transport system membrane component KefB
MADHSQLVLAAVILSLIVIHSASKVGGEICMRLNLPPVLGELLGGTLVGISALRLLVFPGEDIAASSSSLIWFLEQTAGLPPSAATEVFQKQAEAISVMSELGVIILLFEVGLESSLSELLKVGWQALAVAVVGVVAPFLGGLLGMLYIFHVSPITAIFAAAALTATSIGITAKVLSQIGKIDTPEGQIIIGAAILDDILGLIVLAVVAGLSQTGTVDPLAVGYPHVCPDPGLHCHGHPFRRNPRFLCGGLGTGRDREKGRNHQRHYAPGGLFCADIFRSGGGPHRSISP